MTKNQQHSRLYEFRIRYNAESAHCAFDNFHYYMAEDASQAYHYHAESMKKKHLPRQDISIERFNPYSERWENETDKVFSKNEYS